MEVAYPVDPWDWSVNQLVRVLCDDPEIWRRVSANPTVPCLQSLETALMSSGISGMDFLTNVDMNMMKEHLKITVWGQRSTMFNLIKWLRAHSGRYQDYRAREEQPPPGLLGTDDGHAAARLNLQRQADLGGPTSTASGKRSAVSPGGNAVPVGAKRARVSDVATDAGYTQRAVSSELGSTSTAGSRQGNRKTRRQKSRARRLAPTLISVGDARSEQGHGLCMTTSPSTDTEKEGLNDLAADEKQVEDGMTSVAVQESTRMNSSPAEARGEAPVQPFQRQKYSDVLVWKSSTSTRRYMPSHAVPIDDLFYGTVNAGCHNDPDSPEGYLVTKLKSECPGLERFAHKAMRHYLAQAPVVIFQQGHKQLHLLQPYPGRLAQNGQNPSITEFARASSAEVIATRQDLKKYCDGDLGTGRLLKRSDDNEIHDYDYLQGWSGEKDDVLLPTLGDSGSENEYDSDTWEEMQEAIRQQQEQAGQTKSGELSREEVVSAVEASEKEFVNAWKTDMLPKRERKAWKIWRQARRRRTKAQQILQAESELENLVNARLPKLRAEIVKQIWRSEGQLRKQCASLELSIYNREDHLWTIEMLNRMSEPCRPPRADVKRREPLAAKLTGSDDEEILESESGGEDAEDREEVESAGDAFVVPDSPDEEDAITDEGFVDIDLASGIFDDEDSDDEVMTSRSRRRMKKNGIPSRSFSSSPSTASPPTRNRLKTPDQYPVADVVDLTQTSDHSPSDQAPIDVGTESDARPKTSPRTPVRRRGNDKARKLAERKAQESTPVITLDSASDANEEFDSNGSRKILMVRLLKMTPDHVQSMFANRVLNMRPADLRGEVFSNIRARALGQTALAGVSHKQWAEISKLASLYCAWYECKHRKIDPAEWPWKLFRKVAGQEELFEPFHDFLHGFFRNSRLQKGSPKAPTRKTNSSQHPEDDELPPDDTPHRRRKRAVEESQLTRSRREMDRERIQLDEKRRRQMEERFQTIGSGTSADPAKIMVNIGKADGEPAVYLNPHIGNKIKRHQVEGVQFLWREIVQDRRSKQGCLLAHEMGLGKTMQVIALLVTIAETKNSSDPLLAAQIPSHLKNNRTLILCPSSLLDNWADELLMWTPANVLGAHRKLDARIKNVTLRLEVVADWHENGGVLIASYSIFRGLVLNPKSEKRVASLASADHEKVKGQLLVGPSIIVADEAHVMKNVSSAIAQATSSFKSKSRIALTGSPLANNLFEYHSMIDWVAPGYLGSPVEFKANFVEPIEEGLFQDSTPQEVRRSATRLRVLRDDLEPKVSRFDISVLKGDLPSKTEFVIKVPMTPMQMATYDAFISLILSRTQEEVSSGKLLGSLPTLGLLCTHPMAFRDRLTADERERGKRPAANEELLVPLETGVLDLGSTTMADLGLTTDAIQQQIEQFNTLGDRLADPQLSVKVALLEQILNAALEAGDQTLIFSQQIPTLNYLEALFKRSDRRVSRLDGGTAMANRPRAIKAFNAGGADVYLISTKAGGVGLNLQAANRVVIMDSGFNPAWEVQAVGRAYRIGQTKSVFVYRFQAGGTFEDIVYNKTMFKIQLATRVVDKRNMKRHAKRGLQEYFFKCRPVPQDDLSEFVGKDPLVLDRVLASSDGRKSIRSITLTETLQEDEVIELTAEDIQEASRMLKDTQLKRIDPAQWEKLHRGYQARTMPAASVAPAARPGSRLPPVGTFAKPVSGSQPVSTQGAQFNGTQRAPQNQTPIKPPASPVQTPPAAAAATLQPASNTGKRDVGKVMSSPILPAPQPALQSQHANVPEDTPTKLASTQPTPTAPAREPPPPVAAVSHPVDPSQLPKNGDSVEGPCRQM